MQGTRSLSRRLLLATETSEVESNDARDDEADARDLEKAGWLLKWTMPIIAINAVPTPAQTA